jgi:RIO-like serine/threonine protein kinase
MKEKECLKKIRIPLTYKNISPTKKIQKKIDELGKELLHNEICLVHTDYKPNNIFVDRDGEIIVVDFEFMHI